MRQMKLSEEEYERRINLERKEGTDDDFVKRRNVQKAKDTVRYWDLKKIA